MAAAAFNQALTRIGFAADSIAAINQNQITTTAVRVRVPMSL